MNSKLVMAGLTLLATLGASMVTQADPSRWDRHSLQRHEEYNRHHERYPAPRIKYNRFARVLSAEPIWPRPDRYCRIDKHAKPAGHHDQVRVAGALAGAAVGNLIGREHDNALLGTVAGALIGSAGAEIVVRNDGRYPHGKECVTGHKLKYHHQQPVAYWVRYIYRGQVYTTRTRNHPGRYIEIGKEYGRRG